MAIKAVTATTELRRMLRDVGDDGESTWWHDDDDEVYEGILLDHLVSDLQDYLFVSRGGGLFIHSIAPEFSRLSIWPNTPNPAEFTPETGVNYTFYYRGLKIRTTGASMHAGGDITVPGLLIDYAESAACMMEHLAYHRADAIAVAAASASIQNAADVGKRLLYMAGQIRGPFAA